MSYMQGNSDNAITVPFSDDQSEEDLVNDEDKPEESPEERKTRKERRQARLQGKLQDGKRAAEDLAAERASSAELRERLARLEGAVSMQQRPPANDTKDPFEAELDSIYAEQQNAYQAAQAEIKAGTFNADRQRYYETVARSIETRKSGVHTRREMARTEPVRQQNQAQQVWMQKYPEVYGNQRAFAYAQGRYQSRMALGEAITNSVVDEIMEEAKTQFKLGSKPAPTQTERSRLSGVASSGGGGGSKGDTGITLSKEMRRMAIAAYPNVSEDDAVKKWASKTGKKLREKKVM